MAAGYAMVDPNKLMLLTPGIDRRTGELRRLRRAGDGGRQLPGEQRVVPEKCDLNSILFLMTPAEDESKLNTPIAARQVKNLWDADAPLQEVLLSLYAANTERYAGATIRSSVARCTSLYRARTSRRCSAGASGRKASRTGDAAAGRVPRLSATTVDYPPLDEARAASRRRWR